MNPTGTIRRCKVGDIAIVRGCVLAANNGAIVRILDADVLSNGAAAWHVQTLGRPLVMIGAGGSTVKRVECGIADSILTPLCTGEIRRALRAEAVA